MNGSKRLIVWGPVVAAILLVILGALIDSQGIQLLLQSLTILIVIILISGVAGAACSFSLCKWYILPDLEKTRLVVCSFANSRSITDEYMAKYEKECKCKEIWIVTPDLHKDIDLPNEPFSFKDIVNYNITKRGITYIYFVVDEPSNQVRVKKLLAQYAGKGKSHIKVYMVPKEKWFLMPYTDGDFIIYNPQGGGDIDVEGYYELPLSRRDQWIKIEFHTLHSWAGRVNAIMEQLSPLS